LLMLSVSTNSKPADSAALPLNRETRQLFFQLGTTALNNLQGSHAAALFGALEVAEPDQPYVKLGLGMTYLCCSEHESAAQYFSSEIVQSSPLADSANVLLALTHKLSGNASGFDLAAERISTQNSDLLPHVDEINTIQLDR